MLSLFSSAFLLASCSSQDIGSANVPSLVLNTLKAKYPLTNDVNWEKHGSFYEAELEINDGIEVSLQIDKTGTLLMEKLDVPGKDISPGILAVIKDQYIGYTIVDTELINNKGTIYYQVELKGKGKKKMNLIFATDGKEEKSIPYWD